MYENHYRVLDDPFRLTPDDHAAFEYGSYLSGKAFLQHIISDNEKSVVVISGVAGVGKSTLIYEILRQKKDSDIRCSLLQSSKINAYGLLHTLAEAIEQGSSEGDEVLFQHINRFLAQVSEQGRCAIIIIDDAHELSADAFHKLGQLARVILDNQYNAKIFLVGNESLQQLSQSHANDDLNQSYMTGWNLDGLSADEIEPYVKHRLHNAGGSGLLRIDDSAWETIYRFSDGIPRRVNRICSRLLIDGLLENKLIFTDKDVTAAITHLDNEGLLELNSNFASQHGLVGTTRADGHISGRMDIDAFLSGFVDSGPLTEQVDKDIDDASIDIKIAANDNPAEGEEELSGYAYISENENFSAADIVTEPEADTEAIVERNSYKGRIMLVILLLATLAFIMYSGLMQKPVSEEEYERPLSQALEADGGTGLAMDLQAIPEQSPAQATGDKILDSDVAMQSPGKTEPDKAATAARTDTPELSSEDQGKSVSAASEAAQALSGHVAANDVAPDQGMVQDRDVRSTSAEGRPPVAASNTMEAIRKSSVGDDDQKLADTAVTSPTSDSRPSGEQRQQPPQPGQKADSLGFTTERLKAMLLVGFWHRDGRPALLLPSELNKCTDNGQDIFCLSREKALPSSGADVMQHTGAMIDQFAANGTFNVLYRSSKALPGMSKQQSADSAEIHVAPTATREQQMSCRFESSSVINCLLDGIRIRYVRSIKGEY